MQHPYINTAALVPHGGAANVQIMYYAAKQEITLRGDFLVEIKYDRRPMQSSCKCTLQSSNQVQYSWTGPMSWSGFGLPIMGQLVTLKFDVAPLGAHIYIRNVPDADRRTFAIGCRYQISDSAFWTVHHGMHMSTAPEDRCAGSFADIYQLQDTDQRYRPLTPGETSALRSGSATLPEAARTDYGMQTVITTAGNETQIDSALRVARDHNALPNWETHKRKIRMVQSGADQYQLHLNDIDRILNSYSAAAAEARARTAADAAVAAMAARQTQIARAIGAEPAKLFDEACSGRAAAAAKPDLTYGLRGSAAAWRNNLQEPAVTITPASKPQRGARVFQASLDADAAAEEARKIPMTSAEAIAVNPRRSTAVMRVWTTRQ